MSTYSVNLKTGVSQLTTLDSKTDTLSAVKVRYVRRRVSAKEREFIWYSTIGHCYLCKQSIPKHSSWHVERVVAFSSDPAANDVLGNILPACTSCNLRKNSRDLLGCVTVDLTYDLATSSKDVAHLNTTAKNTIMLALEIKHNRQRA